MKLAGPTLIQSNFGYEVISKICNTSSPSVWVSVQRDWFPEGSHFQAVNCSGVSDGAVTAAEWMKPRLWAYAK